MMGLIAGDTLRLPMVPVSDGTREQLRSVGVSLGVLQSLSNC